MAATEVDRGQSRLRVDEPEDRTPIREDRDRPLILLVDDDVHDREIYGQVLWYNGFDVACASDGEAALRFAAECVPDAVVLDIGLFDLSGLDVCSILRTNTATAEIPVIALSAYAESRMGEPARLAGCSRYLEKPASPVAVLHEVEQFLGRPPLPGEGRPPRIEEIRG